MLSLYRDVNPSREHVHDCVTLPDGKIVQKYSIIGTTLVDYTVWEPSRMMGAHSTITTFDGKWYGSITTRPLPAEIEALPVGSEERSISCNAFFCDNEEEAKAIVRSTFPQDFQ